MPAVIDGTPCRAMLALCSGIMCPLCCRVIEVCDTFVTGGLPGVPVGVPVGLHPFDVLRLRRHMYFMGAPSAKAALNGPDRSAVSGTG